MGNVTLWCLTRKFSGYLEYVFVEQGVVRRRNDPLWLALGPELDTGSAGMRAYKQESLISIFMYQLLLVLLSFSKS